MTFQSSLIQRSPCAVLCTLITERGFPDVCSMAGRCVCTQHPQEPSTSCPLKQRMQEETIVQEPLSCTLRERTSHKSEEHHVAPSLVNSNSPLLPATQKHQHEGYLFKFSVVGTEAPSETRVGPKIGCVYEIPLSPLSPVGGKQITSI